VGYPVTVCSSCMTASYWRENRLRQIDHEIAWIDREIEKVSQLLAKRPSKARHVAQLRHQRRHHEIEYALLEGQS